MNQGTHKVTHVLFDMDGLLLDTERFYTIAQDEVFKPYTCDYETRKLELKSKMMGMKSIDGAKLIVEELKLSDQMTPEEFLEKRAKILKELLPKAELLPGAKRLLEHLRAHKVPAALATSSNRVHFGLKTTQHTALFKSVFSHMINGDDVKIGKPNPEIFLKAASMFPENPSPENCLVFEDSPNGIEAAIAGNFKAIQVPDPHMEQKPAVPPHQILKSLNDFNPSEWGLPPFPQE